MLNLARYLRNRLPLRIIAVWLLIVLFIYLFVLDAPRYVSPSNGRELVHHPPSGLGHAAGGQQLVQAIVFIAMGDLARDGLVEYAVASVRKVGAWTGPIYLLTDAPACFTADSIAHDLTIVTIPKRKRTMMEIKVLKPKIFEHLPEGIDSVLYLDVDIVVMRGLSYFFKMIGRDLTVPSSPLPTSTTSMSSENRVATAAASSLARADADSGDSSTKSNKAPQLQLRSFDFAAFGDSRGHYVGFCAGCEKWHTGVLLLSRRGVPAAGTGTVTGAGAVKGAGATGGAVTPGTNACLQAWAEVLSSGRYDTDQESMDAAERSGACKNAIMLPSRFLLFAKDYIAAALTTGHTFVHVTSAARMSGQDSFYRHWVVPRIRDQLADQIDPKIAEHRKQC